MRSLTCTTLAVGAALAAFGLLSGAILAFAVQRDSAAALRQKGYLEKERARLLADRTLELAADPTETFVPPQALDRVPYLELAPLENAAALLTAAAERFETARDRQANSAETENAGMPAAQGGGRQRVGAVLFPTAFAQPGLGPRQLPYSIDQEPERCVSYFFAQNVGRIGHYHIAGSAVVRIDEIIADAETRHDLERR